MGKFGAFGYGYGRNALLTFLQIWIGLIGSVKAEDLEEIFNMSLAAIIGVLAGAVALLILLLVLLCFCCGCCCFAYRSKKTKGKVYENRGASPTRTPGVQMPQNGQHQHSYGPPQHHPAHQQQQQQQQQMNVQGVGGGPMSPGHVDPRQQQQLQQTAPENARPAPVGILRNNSHSQSPPPMYVQQPRGSIIPGNMSQQPRGSIVPGQQMTQISNYPQQYVQKGPTPPPKPFYSRNHPQHEAWDEINQKLRDQFSGSTSPIPAQLNQASPLPDYYIEEE